MHSACHAHCLAVVRCHFVAVLPSRAAFRFGLRRFASRLANASGRIEFIIFLIMDWLFASGCSPPRLSTTQLPSATDSQCSVRRGLSPRCWCALSGALARASPPAPRRGTNLFLCPESGSFPSGLQQSDGRGRPSHLIGVGRAPAPPPSEPGRQISRTRLSS